MRLYRDFHAPVESYEHRLWLFHRNCPNAGDFPRGHPAAFGCCSAAFGDRARISINNKGTFV
jgi:hypothetical protein